MPPPRAPGIKLDAFFQQTRDPVILIGADRRILFVNRAWEQLTGQPAESVIGQECRPHGPGQPGDVDGIAASFSPPPEALDGQACRTTTLLLHPDGEHRWRMVEFQPFRNPEGALIGLLGLVKPVEAESLADESEGHRLRVELLKVRDDFLARQGFDTLIGRGPEHQRLLDQVATSAASGLPVVIVGEVGTGKKLVARTIHQWSLKKQAPILPFDCQALPPEVLERELFGLGRPLSDRPIRAPEGATVILFEILDLPRDLQARLVDSLGRHYRLIATSTVDLEPALQADRLRPDLYYALTTLVIRLRPLRERLDEIPLLAQHLLERANVRSQRPRLGFSSEAIDALRSYDWPGNLRELARVVIDQAHNHGEHSMIQLDDIPAAIRGNRGGAYLPPSPVESESLTLKDRLLEFERQLIEKALNQAGDNKSKAAKRLGVNRPFLYRRLKELGIEEEDELEE